MHFKWFIPLLILCYGMLITAQDIPQDELIIAYTTDADARIERYNPQTQEVETLLTFPDRIMRCFATFPEKNQIAYIVDTPENFTFDARSLEYSFPEPAILTVYDLEEQTEITSSPEIVFRYCPVWSVDGEFAAYITNDEFFVFSISTGGITQVLEFDNDITRMPTGVTTSSAGGDIEWAPDNRTFAFTGRGDVYLYNLDEGLSEVTADPNINDKIISWSPAGVLAIQTSATQSEENVFLGIYSIVDKSLWRVTDDLDGTNIAYTYGWRDNQLIMRLEGNPEVLLANTDTQTFQTLIEGEDNSAYYFDRFSTNEEILYTRNNIIDDDDNYSIEIILENITTNEQIITSHTEANALGMSDLIVNSNGDGFLIIYRYEHFRYTGVYYDEANNTFTTVISTPEDVQFDDFAWSQDNQFLVYSYRTNAGVQSDSSNYLTYIVDMTNGDSVLLANQIYKQNVTTNYPPYFAWISS